MARTDWSEQQAKDAVKRAQARAGKGWTLLGPDLQSALVCRELMSVVLGQAEETMVKNPALAHIADAARAAFDILGGE
jgi:hypothetical protein